jgi:hypothetical protein
VEDAATHRASDAENGGVEEGKILFYSFPGWQPRKALIEAPPLITRQSLPVSITMRSMVMRNFLFPIPYFLNPMKK